MFYWFIKLSTAFDNHPTPSNLSVALQRFIIAKLLKMSEIKKIILKKMR